jgi:hypothetical protein
MGNCCCVAPSTTPGELILVSRNSPNLCIFEHAQALQNCVADPIPLTLRSHPGLAITSMCHSNRTPRCNWDVDLGIGPQEDTLWVKTIRAIPSYHFKSGGGYFIVNCWDQKLLEIKPADCCRNPDPNCCCGRSFREKTSVRRVSGWNDSIRNCVGNREFMINSDGTISPRWATSGNMVLGINDGWKPETISPAKRELLQIIEPAWPLYIVSETGVCGSGRLITGLNFIYEPVGERGFAPPSLHNPPSPSPTRSATFFLKRGEVVTGIEGFLRLVQLPHCKDHDWQVLAHHADFITRTHAHAHAHASDTHAACRG